MTVPPEARTHVELDIRPRPYFSLVVPTIGRREQVDALLESIALSQCQDLEVIIVDQNADDRLIAVCTKYLERFRLRHCRVDFVGAARARNYGAKYTIGKVITFPDDDCELTPQLLLQAKALFESKRLKVLIGVCVDRKGTATVTRFAEDERYLTTWNMWNRIAECTMFFNRETFIESGGFDERFGVGSEYGSDEGPELLMRILGVSQPAESFYSCHLRYFHPEPARNFNAAGIERSFRYARGSGALLAKWPTLPVLIRSVSLVGRAAIASVLFRADKARYYRARVRGFVEGFRLYRALNSGTGYARNR